MRAHVSLLVLLAACSDAGVTKFDSAPTASISSHSAGDTVREGDVIELAGTVSDVDDALSALAVTWTIEGAPVCETSIPDTSGRVTCSHTFSAGGGAVQLEVRDPSGGSGRSGVDLVVQPTDAPTAAITAPVATGTYYSDKSIAFEGIVDDTEDSPTDLIVTWETEALGDLGLVVEVTSEGIVQAQGSLTEGDHAVRLRAVDTTGREALESIFITVGPPNSKPTCGVTLPAEDSAGPSGSEVRLEGTVADVDVDVNVLEVTWTSDRDGVLGASTPDSDGTVRLATSTLTVATHLLTLTATDEVGGTCTDSVYYTVGTPPTLVLTSPTDGDLVSEGDNITFAATVGDGEDLPTDVDLSWVSDLDGTFSTQRADSTGAVSFREDGLSAGDHTLTITATDTDGLYAIRTIGLLVNAPPTAPTVVLSPNPARTANNLTASASGSVDPDSSGTLTYGYAWYEDGVLSSSSTSSVFPNTATSKDHTYRVVVTPNDGTTDGASTAAELTVQNTDPVITGPSLSSSLVKVGDVLTCTATGTDADGDSLSSSVAWSDGSTGATYTVTNSDSPGDTIVCTATVDDGDGGTDVGSASATVQNSDPTVSVALTPSTATAADTLTCTATVSDPDGDSTTASFGWTVGGVATTASSTSALSSTLAGAFGYGQTVSCAVTGDDGRGGTATATASVTITNSPPVVTGVTVSPTAAYTNDTLSVGATISDPEGDSLTTRYDWYVNGVLAQSGTSTTLDGATHFDKDEVVTVDVVVTDGSNTTTETSSGRTILNTAPTAPTLAITPASPLAGDSLTCAVTTASTDADGDAITYSMVWDVDGVEYDAGAALDTGSPAWVGPSTTTWTDDTTDGLDVQLGETWTCVALPDDGDDTGTEGTVSATVQSECGATTTSRAYSTVAELYGFCWYLGHGGETCDNICADVGGSNLANSATTAWSDACSSPASGDVSTWFYNNGNPASWSSAGATGYHTLGYGYVGSSYYGKCVSGTSLNHGTFPGDTNGSSTRTVACPCFAL